MERYERKIVLEYLCRSLENRQFFNRCGEELLGWMNDHLLQFVPVGQTQVKLFDRLNDAINLEDIPFSQKTKLISRAREDVLAYLRKQQEKVSRARRSPMARSIDLIAETVDLSPSETEILSLVAYFQTSKSVEDLFDCVKRQFASVERIFSVFLGLSDEEVGRCLNGRGRLFSSGIFKGNGQLVFSSTKCEINEFVISAIKQGAKSRKEMQSVVLGEPSCSELGWDDYEYLGEERVRLADFLRQAIREKLKGVNVLLYGPPGTGKTEFSKVLAQQLGVELYSVGERGDEGNELDRKGRVACHSLACTFLKGQSDAILLFDEMDDLFESSSLLAVLYGGKGRGPSKVFLNRLLENNPVPTIWTINDPRILDDSAIRRMAFAIEMKTPPLDARSRLWKRMLARHQVELPDAEVTRLARQESVSPAIAENAIRFARLTGGSLDNIRSVTDGLVKALHGGEKVEDVSDQSSLYEPRLANPDTDLDRLLQGMVRPDGSRGFSLCLYGPPGTGKSAFGVHLAERLGMEVLYSRASDLLNSYLGQTEKNIAGCFRQARDEKKVLILDEADSFLQDRRNAHRSWEVTQVNEMLTWMEKHPLPFVCTTNLMASLDQASLRRFTFKVLFNYMTKAQQKAAFEFFFAHAAPQSLLSLGDLTPGDFTVVKKKAEVLGELEDSEKLVAYLREEVTSRQPQRKEIGFCA